jgi:release factor glutamine methyltransferase
MDELGGLIDRLLAAGCVAAEEEAALLAGEASSAEERDAFVRRRERGEPIEWIVGWTAFAGERVAVAPGVYVPRPQTEALARRAAAVVPGGGRLVDLCAGSGAVAVWVARTRPDVDVVAVDIDAAAARCASANGVVTVRADVAAVPLRPGCADVVTAVAPYVPHGALELLPSDVRRHESTSAHDGGEDGLAVVRLVVGSARLLLRRGGWLLLELGGDQDRLLRAELDALAEVARVDAWHDAEGDLRGLAVEIDGGGEGRLARDLH